MELVVRLDKARLRRRESGSQLELATVEPRVEL